MDYEVKHLPQVVTVVSETKEIAVKTLKSVTTEPLLSGSESQDKEVQIPAKTSLEKTSGSLSKSGNIDLDRGKKNGPSFAERIH